MAGGWTRDGAVHEQIEASVAEEMARLRARRGPGGRPSAETCAECDEPIPEKRREAIPGVQLCVECQSGRDGARRPAAGVNRRGSKDSQLK